MIGKLKGVVDEIGEDHCIVDVYGVGYVAWCSARTLAALPSPGEAVVLYIETYVREDVIRLYGFATPVEREWFLLLSSNVQGVGTKVALAVLSTLSPADLANAIALKDIAMVSRAPGVGKKVAERIVVELKNKAPALSGAATGTIGTFCAIASKLCSVFALMKKSILPTGSRMRLFTFGPPCMIVTSRPYLR